MPKYSFKLKNGKTMDLDGDTQPSDEEVESIAKENGVELATADSSPSLNYKPAPIASTPPADPGGKWDDKGIWHSNANVKLESRPDSMMFDFDAANLASKMPSMLQKPTAWGLQVFKDLFSSPESVVTPGLLKGGLAKEAKLATPIVERLSEDALNAKSVSPKLLGSGLDETGQLKPNVLPPGKKIVGKSGIAEDSPYFIKNGEIVPPEIAAEYGEDVGLTPRGTADPVFNTGEFKESQRLKALSYTDTEQYPGTRMNLRDPERSIPVESRDTRLGFSEQAGDSGATRKWGTPLEPTNKKSLGYPLDVVPNSLRPRAVQSQLARTADRLLPDEPKPSSKTVEIGSDLPVTEKNVEFLFGRAYKDNPRAKKIATTVNELHSPELDAAVTDPSFVDKFIPNQASDVKPNRTNSWSRTAANVGSSMDTEFAKQNPLLGELVKRTQVDSHIQAGNWMTEFNSFADKVSDKNWPKLVSAIEGKTEINPKLEPDLFQALNRYKALNQEISDAAIDSGMGLKTSEGKLIPWQPRDNYWPHLYPEEVFAKMKTNPTEFRANMLAQGKTPMEVDMIMNNAKRFGERYIDAQHGREADMPGYRLDKNVYRQHLTEMAKRTKEATNFGAMDIVDPASPISQLISESRNPGYAAELAKKLLDRDQKGNADFRKITNDLTRIQAWMHLTTSGISNLGTTTMIPLQTNTSSFLTGLKEFALNNTQTRTFAESSGALSNIFREIFADGIKDHKFSPTTIYGMDAGETFMRSVSASAGRSYAKQLFDELKSNPNNLRAAKELQLFTLERPENLLKQPELTTQQVQRAAFRAAELSQGMAEKQNLPASWTGSGFANLLTLFHKYQFAQTKAVKDLVIRNPTKAIPLLIGASQVAGEITGDTKAALTGSINAALGNDSGPSESISNRGKFWHDKLGVDEMTARVIENAAQSFALGTYADLAEISTGNGSDALKQLAGPVFGDLVKVFDILKQAGTGNFNKASQKTLEMVPTIGRPLAESMK